MKKESPIRIKMPDNKAVITGITGQTGSYLAEILLDKGYQVYGLKRRSSSFNTERIDHLFDRPNLKLVYGDLADYSSILSLVSSVKPDLFFNMGAQSHVRVSFDIPEYTMDVTGNGVMRCLEAIRNCSPATRFLQASSSEMYGSTPPPQNETTPFHPRSPYAVAKVSGYHSTVNYREAYGLFACNTICFNHESSRRSETFVTRKITRAATRIKLGLQDKLFLGNLEAKRDWGHAKDYAKAMYQIITADDPDDYVVSTGEMHSVQEFVDLVFSKLNLDPKKYVHFDPRYLRPSEVDALQGDSSKLRNKLGWKPEYTFEKLMNEMLIEDMKLAEKERLIKDNIF
jgi:GDPmannose 4,6-dehydratase